MKYLRMLQFALAAFVFCPVAAHAQSLVGSMGGVNLNLVVPRGYCIPDPDNSADAAFVEFLAKLMENSKNHLMRVVVNCRELQARRSDAKKPIHEYVQFYFPMASEKVTLTGDPETLRKDSCDALRQQDDAALSDVPQITEKTAREMKRNGSVSSTKYLGVLDADAHGCYAGILVGVKDGNGNVTLIYTLAVRTVTHRKDLWIAVYSKYGTAADSTRWLKFAQTTAAALAAMNPD